jgi:hypothetical protein
MFGKDWVCLGDLLYDIYLGCFMYFCKEVDMWRVGIVLVLGLFFAVFEGYAQDEEELPVEIPEFIKDPEEMEKGFNILYPLPQGLIPTKPLRVAGANLFHMMFGFVPMEQAEVMEFGRLSFDYRTNFYSGKFDYTSSDYFIRYDADFLENRFEVRYAFAEEWEGWISVDVSYLFEDEGDVIVVRQGEELIEEGIRHSGIGNFNLGLKKEIYRTGFEGVFSGGIVAKVPLGWQKDNLLTSGGADFLISGYYTQPLGNFILHINTGFLFAGEPIVFREQVRLKKPFILGLSCVYKFSEDVVGIAQFQGNQSIFRDSDSSIAVFKGFVGSVHLGSRIRVGSYMLEVSGGMGLNEKSSEYVFSIGFGLPLN